MNTMILNKQLILEQNDLTKMILVQKNLSGLPSTTCAKKNLNDNVQGNNWLL